MTNLTIPTPPMLRGHRPDASIGRVVDGELHFNERGLRLLDDIAASRGCTREQAARMVAWHFHRMVKIPPIRSDRATACADWRLGVECGLVDEESN